MKKNSKKYYKNKQLFQSCHHNILSRKITERFAIFILYIFTLIHKCALTLRDYVSITLFPTSKVQLLLLINDLLLKKLNFKNNKTSRNLIKLLNNFQVLTQKLKHYNPLNLTKSSYYQLISYKQIQNFHMQKKKREGLNSTVMKN